MANTVKIIGRSGADTALVTATEDDVLEGKVIVDRFGEELIGNIPIYTADGDIETIKLNVGDEYTLSRGYYEEGAVKIINDRVSYVNGSATQDEVLEGYTIPIDGKPVEGRIPLHEIPSEEELSLSPGDNITLLAGYYAEDFTIITSTLSELTPGNATANDMLIDKTAWVNGEEITGTIPIRSTISYNLKPGQMVSFEEGYYNKEFNVAALSLASQTVGDATADDMLADKTAWVNGEEITGTILCVPGITDHVVNPGNSITFGAGYYDKSFTVTGAEGESFADRTVGNATANDLIEGKTAWVNGVKITGTIHYIEEINNHTLSPGISTIFRAGYYRDSFTVTAEEGPSLADRTVGDATADDIADGKIAWVNGEKVVGTYTNPIIMYEDEPIIVPETQVTETVSSGEYVYNADALFDPGEAKGSMVLLNFHIELGSSESLTFDKSIPHLMKSYQEMLDRYHYARRDEVKYMIEGPGGKMTLTTQIGFGNDYENKIPSLIFRIDLGNNPNYLGSGYTEPIIKVSAKKVIEFF